MAISHRIFVLFTFPLCCASVAVLITALSTRSWIQATSVYKNNARVNNISYGLFIGTHVKRLLISPQTFEMTMTCLSGEGVCAWSCLNTAEAREAQVRSLYTYGNFSGSCDIVPTRYAWINSSRHTDPFRYDITGLEKNDDSDVFEVDKRFIRMGIWGSTIAFVALAILMGAVGAIFAVVNTAGYPVEPIFGILGLFIWNSVAAAADVVALALWGAEFDLTIAHNVAFPETISGESSSEGRAVLGYSYWLLLLSALLHAVCLGLLLFRRNLVLSEPPAPTIRMEEDPGGVIFLY